MLRSEPRALTRGKCSPYHTSGKFLFVTKPITENHNQSKCRILETVLSGYIMIQLLFLVFGDHCRRKIVKTREQRICFHIVSRSKVRSYHTHKVSPTRPSKRDLNKNSNKPRKSQPYTKNYRQLRNALRIGEIVFPGRAYHLVI